MADFGYSIKNDKVYKLGVNIGFFIAFLLFSSTFYFIMSYFKNIPQSIKYSHAVLLVVVIYLIGFAILRLRK